MTQADKDGYRVRADRPRLLTIPALAVSARVYAVGLDSTGNIGAPAGILDVGWYDGSAVPGSAGVSFIDGHVSGPRRPGVFKRLSELSAGDAVQIEMGDGRHLTYRVTRTTVVSAKTVSVQELLRSDGSSEQTLILMTCGSPFNEAEQAYSNRVIVHASRRD